MTESRSLQIIARVQSEFSEKFGIPRQSGLVQALKSQLIFEPEFRNEEAVRGLDGFSHLWLLWEFSQVRHQGWSPTVRPPRLGGNRRMGVFATRSPFRPNPIGLSAVRLEKIEIHPKLGPVLHLAGGDLVDGTPVFDIKPYLPYADCLEEATGGFANRAPMATLQVEDSSLLEVLPDRQREALVQVLAGDPRPSYQQDPSRVYGISFAGWNVRFSVENSLVRIHRVEKESPHENENV